MQHNPKLAASHISALLAPKPLKDGALAAIKMIKGGISEKRGAFCKLAAAEAKTRERHDLLAPKATPKKDSIGRGGSKERPPAQPAGRRPSGKGPKPNPPRKDAKKESPAPAEAGGKPKGGSGEPPRGSGNGKGKSAGYGKRQPSGAGKAAKAAAATSCAPEGKLAGMLMDKIPIDASDERWPGALTQIPPEQRDLPMPAQSRAPLALCSGSFKDASSR